MNHKPKVGQDALQYGLLPEVTISSYRALYEQDFGRSISREEAVDLYIGLARLLCRDTLPPVPPSTIPGTADPETGNQQGGKGAGHPYGYNKPHLYHNNQHGGDN
jgi:hypothetical protein